MAVQTLTAGRTGLQGGFTIVRDDPIRVTGHGFWTPAQIDAHFAEMAVIVRAVRERAGRVRVLVDLTGAGVQAAETAGRMSAGAASVHQAGDRVAIIVTSNLARLQMRRLISATDHEFFVSPDDARAWLSAG